jgi:predicted choloylglycine hydrolase
MVRKEHISCIERLVSYGFNEEEAIVAITFVHENCMSHEDYVKALKNIGVSQVCLLDDVEEKAA